jgi:ribose-phosphate pyrophosphokinase
MAYTCMQSIQSGGSRLKIFSGNANLPLAEQICSFLEMPLGKIQVGRFSDGEITVEIKENVRGKDVYVIQPTCRPVNENLMELLVVMDALKRASAGCITAVVPYYAYARQDRKIAPRMPIAAKLVADLISAAGAQRLVTMDLHAGQIQGFFDIPVDHLFATPVLLDYIKENFAPDLAIVSPDTGGVERARAFAGHLKGTLAIIDKRREGASISAMTLIGNVWGKEAVIIDDLVNTGGTLSMAAELLMRHGARSVHACVTHPVLAGDSVATIRNSLLRSLITTDTIPLTPEAAACDKIKALSVASLLGEAIRRIHNQDSVSSLFVK